MSESIRESDLYEPVKEYLTGLGYAVHGEVKSLDVAAVREEELLVVELKKSFNLQLVYQSVKRQRTADKVYVAIPSPKKGRFSSGWRDMCFLLRRLSLGLMIVYFHPPRPCVQIIFHPEPFDMGKSKTINKSKRNAIKEEISGRTGNYNTGGVNKEKIMTAYKQNAIFIACCMHKLGPLSPKQLKSLGTGEKTLSILSKNFYGWFEKVSRGKYQLSDEGKNTVMNYPELLEYYQKLMGGGKLSTENIEGSV